ncbi:ABC transporter ATP-binding protein [Geminicoccaceae bacterium 1502E]|nr:ABC transporter ATP-binding protein [Geminicoccaceae bacterium 1502E]
MIRIDNVSRLFRSRDGGTVHALAEVDLEIRDHEFVSIVGPSGCGKSTLLRLVSGLLPPSSGSIAIDGRTVDGPREETGFVFQSPTLLPWATIEENLLFPLRMLRRPVTPAAQRTARELLALVGLTGFERRMPSELSGGMQQRAAICRALMHDPGILLMDEPFGALDALTREEMSLELLRLCAERPKTILFVTHSIAEAVLLSDRVVVMSPRPGRIQEIIDVPLARPRSFAMEGHHEFQDCAQRIRALIFGSRDRDELARAG